MTNSTGVTYRCRNDESRTMEAISENCLDLTGYRASQLIGNGEISYAELIHPEDRAALRSHMQAALRAKRPFRHAYRLITAAKEEKWVWEQGVGVFSPEGGLLAVEGLLVDAADELLAYETLEKRVDERTRELSTLLEVSRNVASTLELQPLLGLILEQLGTVIDYSVAAVFHLSGEDLAVLAYRGPVSLGEMVDLRFRLRESQAHQAVVLSRKPRIISDIRGDAPLARAFQEWAGGHLQTIFNYGCSWMGVPLVARERTVGMLSLYHREPDHFTPRLGQLALAFANEAAVAIANARLYAQAEQAAAAAERNRLARDLHDAVTQTLFSASLTAEVLPQLWTRDPAEGERRLEELRQATRGALAEMRTLLLEMRPAVLTEADLGDLLRQLAEAIAGRARIPVACIVEGKGPLPPDVQVALYRIAQESLNNVAKHAGASHASVELRYRSHKVELCVADDGCGFEPEEASSGHLGLGIMQERAEAIGAILKIESQRGGGSRVVVNWPDREETEV